MKNIVITGSTRGIGLCMAKEFLRAECNVTISGRGSKLSGELKKELSSFGSQILYVSCDVSKVSEVERLWRQSKEKWGSIDIWINNAGQNCPYEYCYETEAEYVGNDLWFPDRFKKYAGTGRRPDMEYGGPGI